MFHAKMLAGALGTDLSMLGFSDLLSGGLGDGGFFRTSVQAAERSRMIRTALQEVYGYLIDLHTLAKWGYVFDPADRPFDISFYGSNSALEAEQQASRERSMNSATLGLGAISQLKDLSLDEETNKQFMEKIMELPEDISRQISAALEKNRKAAEAAGVGGGDSEGGGGFGGKGGFGQGNF